MNCTSDQVLVTLTFDLWPWKLQLVAAFEICAAAVHGLIVLLLSLHVLHRILCGYRMKRCCRRHIVWCIPRELQQQNHRWVSIFVHRMIVTSFADNFLRSCHRCHFVMQLNRPSIQFLESRKDTCQCITTKSVSIPLSISVWQSANYCLPITIIQTCPSTWLPLTKSNLMTSLHPMHCMYISGINIIWARPAISKM